MRSKDKKKTENVKLPKFIKFFYRFDERTFWSEADKRSDMNAALLVATLLTTNFVVASEWPAVCSY